MAQNNTLLSVSKVFMLLGFIGVGLSSLAMVISKQAWVMDNHGNVLENPYHNFLDALFITRIGCLLLILFCCWLAVHAKRQKTGYIWFWILVPILNLYLIKMIFDLPDLSLQNYHVNDQKTP